MNERKSEIRLHNHCGRKERSITYSEYMSVALVILYANCMSHIVICGLSDYHTFSNYLVNGTIFRKKYPLFL